MLNVNDALRGLSRPRRFWTGPAGWSRMTAPRDPIAGAIGLHSIMHRTLLKDWIWAEGRGPELRRVHYAGIQLRALEYLNPDWSSESDVKHLLFHRAQVSMFTPEEVHDYARDEIEWGPA